MPEPKDSQGWAVVATSRFEPNESIGLSVREKNALGRLRLPAFHDINPPNPMAAGNLVESLEEFERTSNGLAALHLELDRDTLLKCDGELGRNIGRVERV